MASTTSTPAAAAGAPKRFEPPVLSRVIVSLAEQRAKAKEAADGQPMAPETRTAFLKETANKLLETTVAVQALISEANIFYIEAGAGRSAAERREAFLDATKNNKEHIFTLLKITPEAMEFAYRACVLRFADAIASLCSILDASMVEDNRSKAEALYDFYYVLSATGRRKNYLTFYMEYIPSMIGKAYAEGFGVLASMTSPKAIEFRLEPAKPSDTPDAPPAAAAPPSDTTNAAEKAADTTKEDTSAPALPAATDTATPTEAASAEVQPDSPVAVVPDTPPQPAESGATPEGAPAAAPETPETAATSAVPETPTTSTAPEAFKRVAKPATEEFYVSDQLFFSLASQIQALVMNEARAAQSASKDGVVYLGEKDDENKPITQAAVDAAWDDAMLMLRETAEYYLIVVFGAQAIDADPRLKKECMENSQAIFNTLLYRKPSLVTPMRGHLLMQATNCLYKGLQECKKMGKRQQTLEAYLLGDSRRLEPTNLPDEVNNLVPIPPGRKPLYVGNFYDNVTMLESYVSLLWRSTCAETFSIFMRAAGVTEEAFVAACAAVEAGEAVAARPNRRAKRAQKARQDELKKALDHIRKVQAERAYVDGLQSKAD